MNDEQFIKIFQENYNRVYNYIGGGDQQLIMSLACKYTLAKKQFSGVILQKVIEHFGEEAKLPFSIQNFSTISYKIAAQLIQEQDIKLAVSNLIENDRILKEVKFKNSSLRIIGALFLRENKQEHAKRAKQLFDAMNRNQRILTSKEDIPYVVVLTASNEAQPLKQAETIVCYYNALRKQRFIIGNHLQALAQIMTIYSSSYNEILMQYVVQLKEELIKRNIKVKKVHYPFLGFLALTATDNSKVDEIVALYNQLTEQKIFKNAKEFALIIAIQKTVQDLIEVQEMIDITFLSHLTDLLDLADFILEIGSFIPGGILDVVDIFK
ncbi:DUF4003 family protein [Lysinibacillus telephonicus]|nr:DUF4003 family protein [Lysinibacillus telephonicus]